MVDIYPKKEDLKYIKNSKWKEDNAKKDGYDLVVKNIEFSRFRVNKNSINWLCKSRVSASCSASITIENDKVNYFVEHRNIEKHSILTEKNYMAKQFDSNVKMRATSELIPTQQIYETELVNITKNSTVSMSDLIETIPSYSKMRSVLRRKRIKTRAPLPSSIAGMTAIK